MLVSIKVSDSELELLNAIREVEHGEMYGVEVDVTEPYVTLGVSQPCADLLTMIRNGIQYIDVLTIHNGEPSLAEVDFKKYGFRCRKKIKFPTVKTEG